MSNDCSMIIHRSVSFFFYSLFKRSITLFHFQTFNQTSMIEINLMPPCCIIIFVDVNYIWPFWIKMVCKYTSEKILAFGFASFNSLNFFESSNDSDSIKQVINCSLICISKSRLWKFMISSLNIDSPEKATANVFLRH